MNKENILGTDVCVTTEEELIRAVESDIETGRKSFIVAINPEKILKIRKDEKLAELIGCAEYPIPDGTGVIIASKVKRGNIRKRITGIDSMLLICRMAAKLGHSIFLYGAKPEVVKEATKVLAREYPGLKIAGYLDGYVKDERVVLNTINASNADILFVALGSPSQEEFIMCNREKLCAKIYQGVGGSYDVISGNIKRAPKFMQRCGLEWLYRLIKQPSRIWRQLLLFKFLFLLLVDRGN